MSASIKKIERIMFSDNDRSAAFYSLRQARMRRNRSPRSKRGSVGASLISDGR